MKQPKMSILVPIYNSSEYLEECLESLISQSLKEAEFILINDGSTDNSLEIIEEFMERDSRFCLINKKNTGYGDSLNQAIKEARGEFIGIVEPDDYCDGDMFKLLYSCAQKADAEICQGNYYNFSNDGRKVNQFKFINTRKKVFNPIHDYGIFYEAPAIWAAIYKKDLIIDNKIEFLPTPGASYQDAGFSFKVLACAKRVSFVDKPLYYYRNDNSNSSVKSVGKIMAVVDEYKEIERFIKDMDGKLMKYCQVAKFGAYNWNLIRIVGKDQKKFLDVMKKEFLRQWRKKLLEKKYFPKKYWIVLRILIFAPEFIYLLLLDTKKRF